ncbi:MAG: hypothetical protein U0271_20595 [Polyangiaceae bacterium]
MLRRSFMGALLGAFGALGFLTAADDADADAEKAADKKPAHKVVTVEKDKNGVTVTLQCANAPYPVKDGKWDDPTVIVFVPEHFRMKKSGKVDAVVHFHGHLTTARNAIEGHHLREQLTEARQNAILVVPQGPMFARSGDFGKLMLKGGLAKLLKEAVKLVGSSKEARAQLDKATLAGVKDVRRVVVSAHSGGYRAAAAVAQRGRVELREIYLFDSLYGEEDVFEKWLTSKQGRKLISYSVGGPPHENGKKLAESLKAHGMKVIVEELGSHITREQLTKGRAIFLLGRGTHSGATWQEKGLRDCLFASCLTGHGTAAWHKEKDKKRGPAN